MTEQIDIPYEKLDDIDFDQIIEKMNEIRNLNTNSNLSDEERRINAENAVLMLSKYLNHIIKKTLKTMKENPNFINNLVKYQKYFLEKLL